MFAPPFSSRVRLVALLAGLGVAGLAAPSLAAAPRPPVQVVVPEEDRFVVVSEHSQSEFQFSKTYLDIARSDDLVIIQITANNTRTVEQKKALFRRIADLLGESPGIRPEDVFVNIADAAKENWSVGNGLAQFA